jgi:3-oxoadipate enol-lactonase
MHATMSDGARIYYALAGDPASPRRVALLHSLAMDHTFWTPVVERLSGEAAVITVDCRGHGRSDKPAGPYSVELFANDLAGVFDHAGWDRAVVGGCSMGGCVSLAFAIGHSARVSGLGLFDTTAWYGADAPAAWEERAEKALAEGLSSLVAFQKTRWFSDGFRERRPDVVQAAVDVFLANDIPAYAESCRLLGAADLRGRLASIKAPTRIIVGSEDYATPPHMAKTMHEGIGGSVMDVVEGARHLSPMEIPDRIADELRALLR